MSSQTQLLFNVRHDGPTSRKCPVGIRFCHGPDAEPVSVHDHYQALRTLANRLVGILHGAAYEPTLSTTSTSPGTTNQTNSALQLDGFPPMSSQPRLQLLGSSHGWPHLRADHR
jgi:hypothetical protein